MPNLHPSPSTASRLVVACSLAIGLSVAQAQTTSPSATAASAQVMAGGASAAAASRLARGDRSFVEDAAASGMADVALGQLAQQRAASAEVKAYGGRMVQDHSKANEELMALAKAKGMTLPTAPTSAQKRMHDGMEELQAAEFDRLYMARMVDDRRKAVALFQEQARSGEDAELTAFAAKTLPTLQEHLKMTTALHDSVKQKR